MSMGISVTKQKPGIGERYCVIEGSFKDEDTRQAHDVTSPYSIVDGRELLLNEMSQNSSRSRTLKPMKTWPSS